jgi:hypothetical protein
MARVLQGLSSMRELNFLLKILNVIHASAVTVQPALWTSGRFLASAGDTRIVLEAVEAEALQALGARRLEAGTMEMPSHR